MKKALITFLAIAAVIAMLVPAFGATPKGFTPEQKKDVASIQQQMLDLRSQMLDKNVEAGLMTKAQADSMKARMKQNQELSKANGYVSGAGTGLCGAGNAGAGQCGGGGCGMGGGKGNSAQGIRGQYAPQNNNVY